MKSYRTRTAAAGTVLLLAFAVGVPDWPVTAQATLALYDDFNMGQINPDRWLGFDSGVTHEQVRQIKGNALTLASRVYSDPANFGRIGVSGNRFTNPTAVTTMEAELRVTDVEATSCSATRARATVSISGSFFNGSSTGTPPNDRTNDVRAGITLARNSDSSDPPRMLRATAFVAQCHNSDCSSATTLPGKFVDFGTVALKRRVRARVEWDEANDQFVFQLGDSDPQFVSYADSASVSLPEHLVGVDEKSILVRNTVAGCVGDRSVAYMKAHVDDVYVNAVP